MEVLGKKFVCVCVCVCVCVFGGEWEGDKRGLKCFEDTLL